MAILKKTIF